MRNPKMVGSHPQLDFGESSWRSRVCRDGFSTLT